MNSTMKMYFVKSAVIALLILNFQAGYSVSQQDNDKSTGKNDSSVNRIHAEYIPAESPAEQPVKLILKSSEKNGTVRISVLADSRYEVIIREYDRGIYEEIKGEMRYLGSGASGATLRIIFLVKGNKWSWFSGLDKSISMKGKQIYCDTIPARTVLPPDGAFNGKDLTDGGYGNPVGRGTISYYPLCATGIDEAGQALGVDMELPLIYRLSASVSEGLVAEFDLATSPLTTKFPGRAFFSLCRFDFDQIWGMRAALKKYYSIYPESFKKRVVTEGIWLPFTPLRSIPRWEDFGFAFHETSWGSSDDLNGVKTPTILSDKGTGVLSFQYTEPWDLQLPVRIKTLGYNEIISGGTFSRENRFFLDVSATYDRKGNWQMRRLETPWFKSGWAVSITTNCDPDLPGFNKYRYVMKDEIEPALRMNVDGIYFDSMEWNWHHDLNYREDHFASADYPLTFSAADGRPVIWNFSSEFKFMKRIADDMHSQGKLAMGNGHALNPFAAANLDLFGAELSWYSSDDHNATALDFKRAISFQKPIVFLLNEGLNDKAFTEAPYSGYEIYFEKMLAYGFFPSFFSVDASTDPYWLDKKKIENGRPFFRKYIPLIRTIAAAGWEPVTYAKTNTDEVRIERFGQNAELYFTLRNNGSKYASCTIDLETSSLGLQKGYNVAELVENMPVRSKGNSIFIDIPAGHTRVLRIIRNRNVR